jgi:hypothetical protein
MFRDREKFFTEELFDFWLSGGIPVFVGGYKKFYEF